MPQSTENKEHRLDALRGILGEGSVRSQIELVERLLRAGFAVTQSSVSRDLRELAAAKVRGRYVMPAPAGGNGAAPAAVPAPPRLDGVRRVLPAGANLLVIHTDAGAASGVALRLDQLGWPEVIGTVAGDDTVFVAVAGRAQQSAFLRRVRRFLPERASSTTR